MLNSTTTNRLVNHHEQQSRRKSSGSFHPSSSIFSKNHNHENDRQRRRSSTRQVERIYDLDDDDDNNDHGHTRYYYNNNNVIKSHKGTDDTSFTAIDTTESRRSYYDNHPPTIHHDSVSDNVHNTEMSNHFKYTSKRHQQPKSYRYSISSKVTPIDDGDNTNSSTNSNHQAHYFNNHYHHDKEEKLTDQSSPIQNQPLRSTVSNDSTIHNSRRTVVPRRRSIRYSISRRIKSQTQVEKTNDATIVQQQNTSNNMNNNEYDKNVNNQVLPKTKFDHFSSRSKGCIMSRDQKCSSCFSKWIILLPSNVFVISWDVYMTLLLACLTFYIPFRVCLYWDDDISNNNDDTMDNPSQSTQINKGIIIFDMCTNISFAFDIFINFITAYEDPVSKRLVTNPRQIMCRYLKGYFFLDLISTIPFGYFLSEDSSLSIANKLGKLSRLPKLIRFLKAIRLLKLLRVYKIQQFLVKLESDYNIHHGVTRLLKILIMVMIVTHLVGCFWYLIGLTSGNDFYDGGWMYRYSFDDKTVPEKYIASLYWAFSTLTTVGYGDISARSSQEQIYSMLMMLLGVSWYAYVVSSMSTVMSSFDAQTKAIRDKMICVNEFIRSAKLPPQLANQVRSYFDFRLSSTQRAFMINKQYDADELLYELSSGLRADIMLHMERHLIEKIPFFKDKVPQFVADMISMLQPMIFYEGEFVVKEGSQADEMYFLTKGNAAVYYGDKHAIDLHAGTYFGEIGCMMGGIRRAGVKATTTCEVQALSRRNLNILLMEYPDVGEELKQVATNRAKEVKREKADENMTTITKPTLHESFSLTNEKDGDSTSSISSSNLHSSSVHNYDTINMNNEKLPHHINTSLESEVNDKLKMELQVILKHMEQKLKDHQQQYH